MCLHAQSANDLIQLLMKVVYPSVQYHFLVVVWKGNFLPEEKSNSTESLLSDLKSEFNSLFTYETKLVFPAVLRAFDKNTKSTANSNPDIYELLDLTQKKEKRIQNLVAQLKSNLLAETENKNSLKQLVETFDNEFFPAKNDWNNMIMQRLSTCACFMKATGNHPPAEQNEVLN
jgi:hypothetical protein